MIPEMNKIYLGDNLSIMRQWPDAFIQTCVTSPPYFRLRDYGVSGQLGMESTPSEFTEKLVGVLREVKRLLKANGTLWLNLGDSHCNTNGFARAPKEYQREGRNGAHANDRKLDALHAVGIKAKDLLGIPWMVAFALRADGWHLRSDIIWAKPNPMPESVKDRPTRAHETIFLLSKNSSYYYDSESIKEKMRYPGIPGMDDAGYKDAKKFNGKNKTDKQRGHPRKHVGFNDRWDGMSKQEQSEMGRNKRTIWTVATEPFAESHFATFPPALISPCILAGCPQGGVVFDPFMGAGTTGLVAAKHSRNFIGCELNPDYIEIANRRIAPELSQGKMF